MTRCTRESLLRFLLAHRHAAALTQRLAVRALIVLHIRAMRPK